MAELGIPMSIEYAGKELVLNDFTGAPASLSGGTPVTLPVGAGLLVQDVQGMDGAGMRNPTTIKPHKSGAIIHAFHREPRIPVISGLVLGHTPADRVVVEDELRGITDAIVDNDGRFFFKPSGQDTRFLTVRNYDIVTIVGPGASAGTNTQGVAGPKLFTFTLIAGDWRAYTYTEDDTTIPNTGASTPVPNVGNTQSYPVIEIYGPCSTGFVITETVTGFSIGWSGTIASGHYIEINTENETMFLDGNGADQLAGLDLVNSDFWSVPVGGGIVTLTGDADHALVKSNSAWV